MIKQKFETHFDFVDPNKLLLIKNKIVEQELVTNHQCYILACAARPVL